MSMGQNKCSWTNKIYKKKKEEVKSQLMYFVSPCPRPRRLFVDNSNSQQEQLPDASDWTFWKQNNAS